MVQIYYNGKWYDSMHANIQNAVLFPNVYSVLGGMTYGFPNSSYGSGGSGFISDTEISMTLKGTSSYPTIGNIISKDPIDVTNFNSIVFDYMLYSNGNTNDFSIGCRKEKEISSASFSNKSIISGTMPENNTYYNNVQLHTEVDISDYIGLYYVGFGALSKAQSGNMTIKFYSVQLKV